MTTVTIKLHGVKLNVTGDTDGHQFDVDCIELVDENELTDLLLSLDTACDIETLASQEHFENPDFDEDAIYEYTKERRDED